MNKQGMSHIEVILSFVIFIGFLIFVLAMFNPFQINSRGNNLDEVERALNNYTSIELEFMTLNLIAQNIQNDCLWFNYRLNNPIYSKNEKDAAIRSLNDKANGEIYLANNGQFFYIYSSKEFDETGMNTEDCKKLDKSSDYSLGLYRNYSVTSFKLLSNLKKEYDQNYSQLKTKLGIKGDFAFSVRDTLGQSIISINKTGRNVYSSDFPIQIAYPTGTLKYAIINIRTWS